MPEPENTPENISATPDAPVKTERPFPNFDFDAPEMPEEEPQPEKVRQKPGPKPKAKPEPEPEPEPEEEEDEEPESPEAETEEDDVEEDYDAPAAKKKEEEIDLDKAPESIARQQAKENGRKVKELSTKLTEFELDKTRVENELAEARKELEVFKTSQIDPTSHPEYKKITESIWSDVEDVELDLPEGKFALRDKFGTYLREFKATKSLPVDERRKALANLKAKVVDQIGNFDSPFDELLEDDRPAAEMIAGKVFDTLKKHTGSLDKLDELAHDIKTKAQNGQLERGIEDYTKQATSISQVLASFEAISEDAIEADPYAPESVVAKMLKGDERYQKRFQSVQRDITEAFAGPRPLTQKELDALEAQGKDLKTFHKERNKQSESKRLKLATMLAQALMTRAEDKLARQELAELKAKYLGEESELDALDKVKPRKAGKPEPKSEFTGPARNRPVPSMF